LTIWRGASCDSTVMLRRLIRCGWTALPLMSQAQEQSRDQQPEFAPTVVVTATRAPVLKKLDRTVYDAASLARAANGSAQDVLQSIPEVSVTADGRIAVKGSAQVTVLIDGKPTAMLAGDADGQACAVASVALGADYALSESESVSLHLRYAHSGSTDYTFSYLRSLQLPDPHDYNPFTTYIDAQNLGRGNPDLQPQRFDALEIGGNREARRLSSGWTAFYRTSRDTVTDARSFADNMLITSRQNGGQARSAGVTGSLDWTPRASLRLGVDGGAYRVMLATPDLDLLVRQSGTARYLNARAASPATIISWRAGCTWGWSGNSIDARPN
jgi:outer membrane receptor for Fe3+-dicitrate